MRCFLTGLLIVAAMAMAGCGDEAPTPGGASATPDSTSTGTEAPPPEKTGAPEKSDTPEKADTPEAIGDAVGTVYVDTMKSVAGAVEGRPDAATLRPELEGIKAQAVERLVELGQQRAALDDAGKAVVNQKVRAGMRRVPREVFQAFSEAHQHYMDADRDLGNLLASFNVITQYADFELLKKQDQKEYERLGLGE